jgi:uncharacterized protein YcgI (DUF1989 family)
LSGCSNAALVKAKVRQTRYQEHGTTVPKRVDGFVIGGQIRIGRETRSSPVNFFSKVTVDEDGGMAFVPGNSKPGMFVELRAEMDVLAILNACQHRSTAIQRIDRDPCVSRFAACQLPQPTMCAGCRDLRTVAASF